MCEENIKNEQPPLRNPCELDPPVPIEKPLSWQPIKDQTDTNPPDGGSGVGDNNGK